MFLLVMALVLFALDCPVLGVICIIFWFINRED